MNKIDFTKPVQIKDGRAVRILCTDGPDRNYPIIGIIKGWVDSEKWNEDGSFCNGEDSEFDLINSPEKRKVEFWVNVYAGFIPGACPSVGGNTFVSRKEADNCAACASERIACLHIVREYEAGEGLDK